MPIPTVTMQDCLTITNTALRDPGNNSYSADDKLEAIRFVLTECSRILRYPKATATIPLVQGTYSYDVTASYGDFLPERCTEARIVSQKVWIRSFQDWMRDNNASPTTQGKVQYIAWDNPAMMVCWPTPDTSYSLILNYCLPVGDTSTLGSVINLPMEWVRAAIFWGVPAILRTAGKEDLIGSLPWQKFLQHMQSLAGNALDDSGDLYLDECSYL